MFPEAKALLENREAELVSSGGWLIGAADALSTQEGIELHVACPYFVQSVLALQGKRITYHIFPGLQKGGEPYMGDRPELDAVMNGIIAQLRPDIVDIHGTEYAQHLSCLHACQKQNVKAVVTLQGILYLYARHFTDGLTRADILLHQQPFHHNVLKDAAAFFRRGEVEKTLMRQARYYIGRTDWDRQAAAEMNPDAAYFHCNETLRDEFYSGLWEYANCEPHRIFVSQGNYPIKGVHQMIKAMPAILAEYPDAMLYVGGGNILNGKRKHWNNYARILDSLIQTLKLKEHICFTGNLDARGVKEQLLKTNVFVSPSTIENSPNSLAEAQLLGVPCVASAVGGVPTMISSEEFGRLYPFHDIALLARAVCQTFERSLVFDNQPMREMALHRHDKEVNCSTLLGIYREITGLS